MATKQALLQMLALAMPRTLTLADFESHSPHPNRIVYNTNVDLKCSDGTLVNNTIHYAVGYRIALPESYCARTVTLVADEVHISGSSSAYTPYVHDTLIYANRASVDAVKLSGSDITWNGLIYALQGEVKISGSGNSSLNGLVYAQAIEVSGSGMTISNGNGYCPPGFVLTRSVNLV